jgi:LacI family transcriptional regulator
MGITIKDVAYTAGVSTATVSRVLGQENSGLVKEETRERVKTAAQELGFRMNHTARSLKRQSTMTIAVVFPELTNHFFMDLAEGIEQELYTNGYTMLLSSSRNSIEEEKKQISMLSGRMVDGMVVIPAGSRGEHFQRLSDQGMPIVLVDRVVEGTSLDAVTSDNEDGAFQLTRALLRDGFKQIAFVGGEITLSSAKERFSGYSRALAEAGITPEPSWICFGGMEMEDGYRLMRHFLEKQNLPEAMVAVNLMVHLGMERCLLDAYGTSKHKIVIAGFDESRYTSFLPACRYTASQDVVGMGRRAGQRIIEKIREKKAVDSENENTGRQVIRLPVSINHLLDVTK